MDHEVANQICLLESERAHVISLACSASFASAHTEGKPHGVNARAVTASEVVETKISSDDFNLNSEVSGIGLLRPVLSYI